MLQRADNDWAAAKEAYVGRPGFPMLKLTRFREAYVNALLDAILAGYQGTTKSAVGSQNETSDYDVTLIGGRGTWSAMKEFNAAFRSVWRKESGVVFDTNIYVGTIPPPTMRHSPDSWIVKDGNAHATSEWKYVQEAASLSKIRRFMDAGEWQHYLNRVTDDVLAPSSATPRTSGTRFTQARHARGAFAVAGVMYDAYARSVARILASEGYDRRPSQSDDDFVRSMEHRDENAVMRARNILYTIHTRGAQNTERSFVHRGQSPLGQGDWRSQASIGALNAQALLYAMEAYHSAGAVFDVVYRQQAGLIDRSDLVLSDFFQSFNEQVGDTLKDLHHYERDPGKAFYQSAKYIRRMTIAADEVLQGCGGALEDEATALLGRFKELGAKEGILLRLRGGADSAFAGLTEHEKSAVAIRHTRDILGSDSLRDFRRKLLLVAGAIHSLRYTRPT
ncbi:hypothetical protein [Streptomyces kronopolitis]|uniref:hypothetical protein n=1 Tax=Streptomyces kronopolitis TaxID=1612435 RepID=UPI0020BEC75E|nr:hypothetical protein [Streptomyces kronopolitis]MCL6302596.1 hypothetical protein [Streptomyces kronopolitis]